MIKLYVGVLFFLELAVFGAEPAVNEMALAEAELEKKLSQLEMRVADSAARVIEFREERFFPFRSKAIELEGIVRMWRDHGTSIEYPDSGTLLMLDERGVLMRKMSADGSFREKSSGLGDGAMAGLLKAALGFDRSELERLFFLTWFEDESGWSIVMTPRTEDEKSIEQVTMSGDGDQIKKIEIGFSGRKMIAIIPIKELLKDRFSEEEKKRYFRSLSGDAK